MKSKENKQDKKETIVTEEVKDKSAVVEEVVDKKEDTNKTQDEVVETLSDGYHNPKDVEMIKQLRATIRTASDNIRDMQQLEEITKNNLIEKENLINQASKKIEEQDLEISRLKQEKEEILNNKGSIAMQEEISKAIEFGNNLKEEAKKFGESEKERIISEAEAEAKRIISEANKEAKLEMERRDEANKAYHEVMQKIELYHKTFGELLTKKKEAPNYTKTATLKEDETHQEQDLNANDDKSKKGKKRAEDFRGQDVWGAVPTSKQGSEKQLREPSSETASAGFSKLEIPKVTKSDAQMRLEAQLASTNRGE